jgi:hypothetical protein
LQYGAAPPQACSAALPKLPLHAAHALDVVSQIGVVPLHAAVFPDTHCTHWFDAEHTGVAAGQSVSAPHASHLPAFAPLPALVNHLSPKISGPPPVVCGVRSAGVI